MYHLAERLTGTLTGSTVNSLVCSSPYFNGRAKNPLNVSHRLNAWEYKNSFPLTTKILWVRGNSEKFRIPAIVYWQHDYLAYSKFFVSEISCGTAQHRKVRPRHIPAVKFETVMTARQLCSDWHDARILEMLLIHITSWQHFFTFSANSASKVWRQQILPAIQQICHLFVDCVSNSASLSSANK